MDGEIGAGGVVPTQSISEADENLQTIIVEDVVEEHTIGSESSTDGGSDFDVSDGEEAQLFEDGFDSQMNRDIVDVPADNTLDDDDINVDDEDTFESLEASICRGKDNKEYPHFNSLVDFDKPIQLAKGMIFDSNDIFRKALRIYTIEQGGDYYYLHNDKSKVSVYCKHRCDCKMEHGRIKCTCAESARCTFKACARRKFTDGTFQLKSFQGKHDCGWQEKNTKVSSKWLADMYKENYRDDPSWKLSAFINDVKRKYKVEIGKSQAWKARFKAIMKSQGDAREQYAKIWDYAATIIRENAGSSAFVKVDLGNPEKPLFQRIYVNFAACIKGFKEGCRPVIGVDGCHLRGTYTGQIFVAVSKDGNNQLFPIAFAIVEAERRETWGWFLHNLLGDIGDVQPTFMSDRQKGLVNELSMLVEEDRLRVCVRHMYNNFKQYYSGNGLKELVWAAARAYTKKEFTTVMDQIKKMNENAFNYLMKEKVTAWSRHAFRTDTKSDMLLNNVCETFNSIIIKARDKPVITCCEWIRRYLMSRFVEKRKSIANMIGSFTPNATKLIEASKTEGLKSCQWFWGGGSTYEVDHHGKTFIVDLDKKTCGCFKWDLTGIPCPHAMYCIIKKRFSIVDYVDKCYTLETYKKAYGSIINTMPGEDQYETTSNVPPLPPKLIIQPGRPKLNARRKEAGEEPTSKRIRRTGYQTKCTNCRQPGHFRNKCTNEKVNTDPERVKNSGGRPRTNATLVDDGYVKRKYTKRELRPQTAEVDGSNHQEVEADK